MALLQDSALRADLTFSEDRAGPRGSPLDAGLHGWLDELQIKMNRVGNAIYETFFAAAVAPIEERDAELEARYPVESIPPREG